MARAQALDLDGNQLTSIPADIGQCRGLEILRLSRNRLRSVPTSLQGCHRLKLLAISDNVITCLPPPLGNCAALESIEAADNALVDVPASLSRLARLRTLVLNGNGDLKGIPGEILLHCERLHTLEVHDTQITREVRVHVAFAGLSRSVLQLPGACALLHAWQVQTQYPDEIQDLESLAEGSTCVCRCCSRRRATSASKAAGGPSTPRQLMAGSCWGAWAWTRAWTPPCATDGPRDADIFGDSRCRDCMLSGGGRAQTVLKDAVLSSSRRKGHLSVQQ